MLRYHYSKHEMKKHRAFTIIEIMMGILIMTIVYAVSLISIDSAKQTAKREAERVAAYLYRQIEKAERIHKNFYIEVYTDFIRVNWYDINTIDDSFKAHTGCKYSAKFKNEEGRYNASKKLFNDGGTIKVTGADGKIYYVILAGINEGRIRISDTQP